MKKSGFPCNHNRPFAKDNFLERGRDTVYFNTFSNDNNGYIKLLINAK